MPSFIRTTRSYSNGTTCHESINLNSVDRAVCETKKGGPSPEVTLHIGNAECTVTLQEWKKALGESTTSKSKTPAG